MLVPNKLTDVSEELVNYLQGSRSNRMYWEYAGFHMPKSPAAVAVFRGVSWYFDLVQRVLDPLE
jgi:hypothetical protein